MSQQMVQEKTQELAQEMLPRGGPRAVRTEVPWARAASYDEPQDLIDAQSMLDQLRADLRAFFEEVP